MTDMNGPVQKLLDALRSGEYTQSRHRLRTSKNTYCCLGVACDIYRKETGNGYWYTRASGPYFYADDDHMSSAELPDPVRDWYGFHFGHAGVHRDRQLDPHDAFQSPIGYNDAGYDFTQIADLIEKHYDEITVSNDE